ncbi:MAG TPA: sulfatase [Verrucomicrobiae bacterium]|nr:sulfatase [Verrucomicrobiae bacterium]
MRARTRALGAGVAGGLVAGAAVGAAEALAAWVHLHGPGELPALGWALAAYGAVGAGLGLGAGVAAALAGGDGFCLALAGVGTALACAVARFRIIRDVFLEQVPHGLVPLAVQVGALVVVALGAVLLWRALRGADERRAPLTRPGVAAIVVALLAAAWAGGTQMKPPPAPAPLPPRAAAPAGAPNVVLIMVDTLRADHLSCYGSTTVKTPHIDALAADGLRWVNTFSQASWTRPSVATILTGLYPSSHGAVHKADRLPDRVDTLAEVLGRAGYHTVGFADNANISQAFNFQQGFDEYHYLAPDFFFGANEPAAQLALYSGLRLVRERFLARYVDVHHYYQPAEVVTAEVRGWLDRSGSAAPFFLFAHYMDPHDPYFVHPFNGEGYARVANPNPAPEMAERLHRLYISGIEYLDEHLGVLLEDLKRRGLYDRTLVVLTADHGEEFREHGGWWHGTTLYDEQIHVPLIVKPAGAHALAGVRDELATSLDIAPTIVAAARLTPPAAMQGHVLPLDGGAAPARESTFAEEDLEGNVLQAVRTRAWKLIAANPGNPRGLAPEELYDLPRDPGEHRNVIAGAPDDAEKMRATLGRAVLEAREHGGASEPAPMDEATKARLKALGYTQE